MSKAPADQFYYGDWLRDVELQQSCACTKGVWMNALAVMWFANPRGELKGSWEDLIKLCLCTSKEFDIFWKEAEALGFCYTSRNSNGNLTLRNRRMYREEKAREANRLRQQRYYEKRKPNGASNGKPNGDLTPPSSSSTSSSKDIKIREYVKITNIEHEKLQEQFSSAQFEWMLDKLDYWAGKKDKPKVIKGYGYFRKGSWLLEEMEKHFNMSPKDSGLCEKCGKEPKYLGGLCSSCHYQRE